jgi:hypothetical protein
MGYVELPDGTRVYDKGLRYKPLTPEQRKYKVRKPKEMPEGMVRWRGDWLAPLALLLDAERSMPHTIPDDEAAKHRLACACFSCKHPRVRRLKRARIYRELRSS